MQLINAAEIVRMVTRDNSGNMLGAEIEFGTAWWFIYAGISCFLVLFAGIMSGLTLGLMSLSLVDLEILERSGTLTEKKQAGILITIRYLFVFCSKFSFLVNCLFVNEKLWYGISFCWTNAS